MKNQQIPLDPPKLQCAMSQIFEFAAAPLLSETCASLDDYLGLSTRTPNLATRKQDLEARKRLLTALKAYEESRATAQLLDSLSRITNVSPARDANLKEIHNIKGFLVASTLYPIYKLVLQTLQETAVIRINLGREATAALTLAPLKLALNKGTLFVPTLFHPDAVANAQTLSIPYADRLEQDIRRRTQTTTH